MTVPDVVKSRTLRVGQRVVRAMRIIVDDLPQGIVCSGNVTARHQVNFPQRPRCELHMEGLWQGLDARLLPHVGRFLEGIADAMDVLQEVKVVSRVTGNSRDARFLIAFIRAAETFRNVCVHLPTQVLAFSDREFAEEESEVEYDVQSCAGTAPCGIACQEG